jgi:hypothetical protein
MVMSSSISWKDLDTKGFLHVPGFLTPDQLEACRADYANKPQGSKNGNFNVPGAGEGISALTESVTQALTAVAVNSSVKVDTFIGASYFATKRGVKFNWHQDHESYFLFQTHVNYLNLYIPIVKPRRDKSNLCVIPFDVLERESPDTFRASVFRGATTVHPLGEGQFLVHDDSGAGQAVPINFDDIAAIPQMDAGDLLILRGDVFHKTEDSDTDRVSLSIRMAHSKTTVSRSKLADGGLLKSQMLVRNMSDFEMIFRAFDVAGKDELPWGELRSFIGEARTRFSPGNAPKLFLLKEKIRAGVLLASAHKAVHEVGINPLKALYNRRQRKRPITLEPLSTQPARVRP